MNLFPTNCTTKFTYPHMGDYFDMFQLFLIAILWEKKYTHIYIYMKCMWSINILCISIIPEDGCKK